MKQLLALLALTLFVAAPNLGSAVPQQPPEGHPAIPETPPSHPNVPTTKPQPLPEQQEALPEYVLSVEAIVNAAFETISGPKGEARNWDKYRELFFPEARMYSTRVMHTSSIVNGLSVEDFIAAESKYLQSSGYFETPINMKIEQFSNIAQVRSVYEARRGSKDAPPYLRGIYSIQLVKTGGRWWILNMLWQTEDPTNPIPDEFLK